MHSARHMKPKDMKYTIRKIFYDLQQEESEFREYSDALLEDYQIELSKLQKKKDDHHFKLGVLHSTQQELFKPEL